MYGMINKREKFGNIKIVIAVDTPIHPMMISTQLAIQILQRLAAGKLKFSKLPEASAVTDQRLNKLLFCSISTTARCLSQPTTGQKGRRNQA